MSKCWDEMVRQLADHNTPTLPYCKEGEDIVYTTRKVWRMCDVGSSHPGAGEGKSSLPMGNHRVINKLKTEKAK